MELGTGELASACPEDFSVEDRGEILQVWNESGRGANVEAKEDSVRIEYWNGLEEEFYDDEEDSEGFVDLEDLLADERVPSVDRAKSKLSNGFDAAYECGSKKESVRYILESSESAKEALRSEGKAATNYDFSSEVSGALGNLSVTVGSGSSTGTEKFDLDMNRYGRDFATEAAYISGVVMLEDSDRKPAVSTGVSYKPGSSHHDNKEEKSEAGLVETAQELSEKYDFLS